MAKRRVRKSKVKTKKRKTTTKRKKSRPSKVKAMASNRKALWGTYQNLQKKVDKAWAKIRSDIKRKANPHTIVQDRNHLLLLLGECNYMARECMRIIRKTHR